MNELAQLQADLVASMVGLIVFCLIIAATIGAGHWLLVVSGERRRKQYMDEPADDDLPSDLNVHLEIGDCRRDCGCEKPCGECE